MQKLSCLLSQRDAVEEEISEMGKTKNMLLDRHHHMQTRRSARAAPSKRKSLVEPESDEWHSEEDSDFDGSQQRIATKPTLAKRGQRNMAATSKSTKHAKKKPKRIEKRWRDLSLLPTMPLDILFAICAALAPQDLVSLSRVDRNFCRTLTANNVSFVWKAVREAEEGIEPPRGIPEYRWVDLLFGKTVCDFCPANNVRVDWKLRRRVCKRCLKEKYVQTVFSVTLLEFIISISLIAASQVRRRFPDVNADFLSLVSHTDVPPAGPGTMCARGGYYWISDIAEVEAKIKELEADPGSSKHLAEFRTERKKLVEDMTRVGAGLDAWKYEGWANMDYRKRAVESQRRIEERFSMIRTRLLALGYTERDVKGIRWQPSVEHGAELTPRGWNRICPGLEAMIQVNRIQQAKEDRIINTYKQQFLPVVWREIPSLIDICIFVPFREILELPTDSVVTEADFADAVKELPNLIANWQQQMESKLRAQVPTQETGNVDPLKLATTIFSCQHKCRAMITNADIWWHRCDTYSSYMLQAMHLGNADEPCHNLGSAELFFDVASSAVAASLVKLVFHDPATMTAEEMDSLNVEFLADPICTWNLADRTGSCCGRHVLSWRECVEGDFAYGSGSDFHLLTPDDEAKKRAVVREDDHPWVLTLFHCQHCSVSVDPQVYGDVMVHLKDAHGIDDPVMNHDLFLTPGEIMPPTHRPPLYIVECERDLPLDSGGITEFTP
ncbi:hypothetical protein IW261DRAFT_1587781 [Armillaria novae-zelandiae]|uniref:F-box domain-containing protein n=1 Tax=Armillaria novae-zelandiae TaxID=153914 RepID=A0AA39PU74_9AGAR|nr:hypothetical protein IW261DRAFT_1587781 [Armillaria novae-zelandiae]